MWDYEKEFISKERLMAYLNRIERLTKAEIIKVGFKNWILRFNISK